MLKTKRLPDEAKMVDSAIAESAAEGVLILSQGIREFASISDLIGVKCDEQPKRVARKGIQLELSHWAKRLAPDQVIIISVRTNKDYKIQNASRKDRYLGLYFIRLISHLPVLDRLYHHSDRMRFTMSLTETYGRMLSAGLLPEETISNDFGTFIKATSDGNTHETPSREIRYGPLIKLKRVGYKQKTIFVYKFRTMHSYAEHLQSLLYEINGMSKGDKIPNDFRVTGWGKVFRKYWIDELPMLLNLLKRDLKLVGPRPVSMAKFALYSEELQLLRTSVKPGLLPPYYADLPSNMEEMESSERAYVESYHRSPLKTDFRYFVKAVKNILLNRSRSL